VLQNDTPNNATNALRDLGVVPEVQVNHYLTSTTAFFLKTNCPDGGKLIPSAGFPSPEFTKDNDFDTENAKAKCYFRFSVGWSNPRFLYSTAGA
jgi:hypothetical protein